MSSDSISERAPYVILSTYSPPDWPTKRAKLLHVTRYLRCTYITGYLIIAYPEKRVDQTVRSNYFSSPRESFTSEIHLQNFAREDCPPDLIDKAGIPSKTCLGGRSLRFSFLDCGSCSVPVRARSEVLPCSHRVQAYDAWVAEDCGSNKRTPVTPVCEAKYLCRFKNDASAGRSLHVAVALWDKASHLVALNKNVVYLLRGKAQQEEVDIFGGLRKEGERTLWKSILTRL